MRRDKRVRALLERAGEACAQLQKETAEETGELKLVEFLHAQLDLKPNQFVVLAVFENKREPKFELRCHICKELLSQLSLAAWPVSLHRTDGSSFPAVMMTCDDPACAERLRERLSTEGP